jgi:hypothetical protein
MPEIKRCNQEPRNLIAETNTGVRYLPGLLRGRRMMKTGGSGAIDKFHCPFVQFNPLP